MSYVRGEDRDQRALLPAAVEDYVAAGAPVRVIDAFVDGLDLTELGFGRSLPAATGRPPYDPRDLLKLYLYGNLNEALVASAGAGMSRNVEVMWLVRRLAADFQDDRGLSPRQWRSNREACRAFVLFCRDQGFHDALQRMNARVKADPGLMRQRRCAAEHPFGTIKRMTAGGRFLTRSLAKVKAEAALSILAYNILRAINLIGATELRARLV